MILLQPRAAASADPVEDLREDLRFAIKIEHATIPPYLTALFSLKDGTNEAIRVLVRSVVVQEMEHMTLAANMLSAVGGTPVFTDPDFIPQYPGGLPFDIGDRHGKKLTVGLEPFSPNLVQDIFMAIEEPENPIDFPVGAALLAEAEPRTFRTIGDFYADVRKKFVALGPTVITGDPKLQLDHPHGAFRIRTLGDALRAIDQIVQQGEGTTTSPLEGPDGIVAHYYRFAEIVHQKTLIADASSPQGFSYSGEPIPYDGAGVYPIVSNAKNAMYPPGSLAARLSRQFDGLYGNLLQALEHAYCGADVVSQVIGLMFDLKIVAKRLMSTPVPELGKNAAPAFEYALAHAAF
jgi:hypothetical protein